ncbi:hypothetical protein SAMD00019534_004940 [Acytostelium subglobosum LB1]|uniref:hypothetical protein n=1 Tax=Acytostelium subglobosum LB1 TaxID=1410327 RepID=UPI000644B1AE|nr:hypothetical protein SAMD00019534_004940 [Acytostelium subglobosum LB1]GAM17319.1 hypothetical protein SAMD00019534_004940 [Acytostelium subglobosum LB1]|eukprot:XP_012759381.1 hypothetical protein SAMD00019534_004940 [Acytostelium subglobosum LB1]
MTSPIISSPTTTTTSLQQQQQHHRRSSSLHNHNQLNSSSGSLISSPVIPMITSTTSPTTTMTDNRILLNSPTTRRYYSALSSSSSSAAAASTASQTMPSNTQTHHVKPTSHHHHHGQQQQQQQQQTHPNNIIPDFTTDSIINNINSIPSSTVIIPSSNSKHTSSNSGDINTQSTATISAAAAEVAKTEDDLEIKDANIIFNTAWNKLEQKYGKEDMRFPQEIIYLMGAPGSGKGTNTPFISSVRGITAHPIVMSSLLNNSEARRIKATGGMVNDSFVFYNILEELRKTEYRSGVVVDGFPRTNIQVECLNALYEKMKDLRKHFFNTNLSSCFPRPVFRVTVLFVEEKESIDRQIRRGQITRETNIKLKGQGLPLLEERDTDTSEDAARKRYKIFRDHYSTLQTLKKHFPFTIIDASKAIGEVQQSIIKEFQYQSSLELAEETYDMVQRIPLVSDVTNHARVDLVTRLDEYQFRHTDLFASVINVIDKEFIPNIRRHSIAGSATVRITNRIFSNPIAVDMALDVLSERGFRATVDVRTSHIPHKINPTTMEIETITQHEYQFKVDFQRPFIRDVPVNSLLPQFQQKTFK